MNILIASSEVVPFAKTGGLGDVCGSLPAELARLGQHPVLIMPAHRQVWQSGACIGPTGIQFEIPVGTKTVRGQLLKSRLPNSDVPVYLVQQDDYFDRSQLYSDAGDDYKDNCERFVFFCRAVIESIRRLDLSIDLLHCNDWQTGLIPAYLKIQYQHVPTYQNIAALLTIHNMAYQGNFWHWDMLLTGLDWKYFNWRQMEFHGHLNLLKTGIVFSDSINTVSPTYAREIQRYPLGCGLEDVLRHRRDVLSGIINGVNDDVWNPATDPYLAAHYTPAKCKAGKAQCKAALQRAVGLPDRPGTPVLGLISRLTDQKGWNLIIEVIRDWVRTVDAQWVILGTGEPKYRDALFQLAQRYPDKVAAKLTFSDQLAHQIEAGADMFVMPSRYEPCGLNQLYSLKYGTVPVVRATGGLADTITDATPENLACGQANGFSFRSYDTPSLDRALRRAYNMYCHDKKHWRQLIRTGMRQDWSWTKSAKQYIELYETTIQRQREKRSPDSC